MPSNNLAMVFGPTVIGYSVPDPEPLQMINETKCQAMVSCVIMSTSNVITLHCIINTLKRDESKIEIATLLAHKRPHAVVHEN